MYSSIAYFFIFKSIILIVVGPHNFRIYFNGRRQNCIVFWSLDKLMYGLGISSISGNIGWSFRTNFIVLLLMHQIMLHTWDAICLCVQLILEKLSQMRWKYVTCFSNKNFRILSYRNCLIKCSVDNILIRKFDLWIIFLSTQNFSLLLLYNWAAVTLNLTDTFILVSLTQKRYL